MELKDITFDTLYKNADCFLRNVILMSKIMNQFWTYDSVTDEPMISHMESVCESLSLDDFTDMNDYFEKTAAFSQFAIKNIIRDIHTKIQREHLIMPARQVKETDSRTMEWLATRPGRNIREKLSGKNQLLAPVRFSSCDTQENRIFKSFLSILNVHFVNWKKFDAHNKQLEALYYEVYRWLKSEDAASIHNLNSSLPNNTLLNDKNYRKIWKAWNNIQLLDAMVRNDCKKEILKYNFGLTLTYLAIAGLVKKGVVFLQQPFVPEKQNNYNFSPLQHSVVTNLAKNQAEILLYFSGRYTIAGSNNEYMPVEVVLKTDGLHINIQNVKNQKESIYFAENQFIQLLKTKDLTEINKDLSAKIAGALKNIGAGTAAKTRDSVNNSLVLAIDCTQQQPCYSYEKNNAVTTDKLNANFIAQKWVWEKSDIVQIIPAPYLKHNQNNKNLFNITLNDVIDSNPDFTSEDCQKAADIFAKQLKKIFPDVNHFVYLVPDKMDDFAENYLAVAFDVNFLNVVPVPRSIARVFQWQQSKEFMSFKFAKDSYVRIIESSKGGLFYVTDIKVKFPDEKTKAILSQNNIPQCITWERQPTEVYENLNKAVKRNNIVKTFNINSGSQLTDGALYYFTKQQNVGDIPLWNDHLLELAMMADNTDKPIVLVGPNTIVNARKGRAEKINVPQKDLSIAAGIKFAEFRLIIGKDDEKKKKYYAYVENPNIMPFTEDTSCELELFYTYGAQKPYTLYLKTVVGGIIKRIEVRWEKNPHKDYVHVPGPEYITEMTWDEALNTKLRKSRTMDVRGLFERTCLALQCVNTTGWQHCKIDSLLKDKVSRSIKAIYLDLVDSNNNNVVCFPDDFAQGQKIQEGLAVSCLIVPSENPDGSIRTNKKGQLTLKAIDVQINDGKPNKSELSNYISPVLHLWNQGRSARNPSFPSDLFTTMQNIVSYGKNILNNDTIPPAVKNEVVIILAAFHENADIEVINYLKQVLDNTVNKHKNNQDSLYCQKRLLDAISYALGNIELEWQKDLFSKTMQLASLKNSTEEHQMCIDILGRALWRTRNSILALKPKDVDLLLNICVQNIENFVNKTDNLIPKIQKFAKTDNQNKGKAEIRDCLYELWRAKFSYLKTVELILALYRLRNHQTEIEEECLRILAPLPENRLIQRLKTLFPKLEQFSINDADLARNSILKEQNLKYKRIKSRIEFEINDQNWNRQIPDYLYVLEKYTKGESGGIKVLGIEDTDSDA